MPDPAAPTPFWHDRPLEELSTEEWESLCDGCGRCCLVKWEDEETGRVAYTDRACNQLDLDTVRCTAYTRRSQVEPDCMRLTPALAREADWLPESCAYRRLADGRDLPPWHPLRTGDPDTARAAGISIQGLALPEGTREPPVQFIEWWDEEPSEP